MTDEERPRPEEFLAAFKREESAGQKGKLKIFLGMAAGVGKTYALLEEARQLKNEGIDLVIGTVNTHGRQETAFLLTGLSVIEEKAVLYRGREFYELDLDTLLKRKPELAIIDELAHTNVPGSRHAKRWQDVMEILENGIDVYTTLNVQHIESLKDIVESITSISVRETVPDLLIEIASSIQLVDLTPEKLLQRLEEGKVYLGGQSQIAARNFFQKNRLTALREIVLRYTAEKVDHDLHGLVSIAQQLDGWKPRERLLVAISHSPHSQKLIRTACRLAFNIDAPWIALHVNDGRAFSKEDDQMLEKNLTLARELGAEVLTTNDPDVAEGLQRLAHQRGVTQIIVGRPPREAFLDLFRGWIFLDKLASKCKDIDIHIISQENVGFKQFKLPPLQQPLHYFLSFVYVSLFGGLNWLLVPSLGYLIAGFTFLLSVLCLTFFFKKWPIFLASIIYALIWDFFFIPPVRSLAIEANEDLLLLLLYFLTAVITGILVDRARENKQMLTKREESTQVLYDIARQIVNTTSTKELLKNIRERLEKLFPGKFEIVVKQLDNFDHFQLYFDPISSLVTDEKEKSAALWVLENGKEAGCSTQTLPSMQNLYIPLKGFHETVGILIFRPKTNQSLTTEEKNFLYTVGHQLSNYLERSFIEEKKRQEAYFDGIEKVSETVLKSTFKELHPPLITIQEAVQALKYSPMSDETRVMSRQVRQIENTSDSLLRMLENVSVMAKLSGSLIPLHKQRRYIKELITVCHKKIQEQLDSRTLSIKIEDENQMAVFDLSLLEILLSNLLLNAIQASPQGSLIQIETKQVDSTIIISVSDEGIGIPPDMLESVFEKFFRLPGTTSLGMGLGLTICKRIAEIHQGYLQAKNLPVKGVIFSFFLPIEQDNL